MKVEVDEKGRPVNVYQKVTKEANWLIEECMLLANRTVAEFVATGCKGAPGAAPKGARKQPKTFVYRVHDEPNQEKVEALRNFIGNFGYKMGSTSNGKEISKELNSLFAAAKDTPEYNAIELLSLRTMAKARYDTENLGHYGLAFKYYTHFTSPIRRYPDMLVHRLLASYLEGGESARKETYDKLCKHASEREVVAAEAERASIKYKLVEFMQDKVGYVFGGHISGLTEWGMYVEVEPTMIEGMVPLRDIKSDFFEFDADHYRLVGRRSKVVYNLGDPVRIRVKKTNLEQKLLDYELIEDGSEDRLYDRIEYEHGRGTSFIKGEDGSFDNVTVGINKAARKEKVRKAIQESKRKARKSGKSPKTSGKSSKASGKVK
jgi:ribonuclease R